MAVLPMPFSIVPHHRRHKLVCKASSVITTHQPQTLFQRVKFQEPTQHKLVSDYQSLFGLDVHILSKPERSKKECFGGQDKEIAAVIQRLEAFAERAIELETQKFENKTKGLELSDEESRIVQDLSREIVSKFLEKPIQFLRSSDEDLEEKLKELQFLATILEESC
ncbi:hypothetical protein ACFX2I_031078 [Malus domestica]